ncbi:MAG: S1 RNA-binding domain-containing protein [bacterium]|nr:S1 RNA-binding domain-containing protein [Candidatus Colisoma equi]
MMGSPDQVGVGGERIAKYGVGRKCRGKVVNFKPYGFFVETEDGGFGLVHGRNIRGWQWGLRFDKVFRHGSEIDVEVVDIEDGTNRMSFACEMPAGYADEVEPEVDSAKDEDLPPPLSRREVAEKWREENAAKSKEAYEWLKAELADGPLYGPLTNVLCDRFEVPVPVSQDPPLPRFHMLFRQGGQSE